MRTLLVSDIHGNLAALRAVLAQPHDHLVCLGDIVGYGPRPAECLALIREAADLVVCGNHDYALATGTDPRASPAFGALARATAAIAAGDIGKPGRDWLRGLPQTAHWSDGSTRIFAVHATPHDPLYQYLTFNSAEWKTEVKGLQAGALAAGHTHVPGVRRIGEIMLVNPGSVGQPKDGDPRAAYAVLEDGAFSLRRAAYPVEETVVALRARRLEPAVEAALSNLLRTGTPSRAAAPQPEP